MCWCSCIWCWKSLYVMPGQPCGYFWDFFPKIFGTALQDSNSLPNNVSIIKHTVGKEFFIHIIEICCKWGMWSRVIVIGYLTDNMKAGTFSAIHYLQKSFVFELWFPSRIVSAYLYVAMTSWQMERVNNRNYRNLLRNVIVGINWYKLLILRKIMFSK